MQKQTAFYIRVRCFFYGRTKIENTSGLGSDAIHHGCLIIRSLSGPCQGPNPERGGGGQAKIQNRKFPIALLCHSPPASTTGYFKIHELLIW
jgi:hypothetical protein